MIATMVQRPCQFYNQLIISQISAFQEDEVFPDGQGGVRLGAVGTRYYVLRNRYYDLVKKNY